MKVSTITGLLAIAMGTMVNAVPTNIEARSVDFPVPVGPPDVVVYLKDVDPNAILDGKPAPDDAILDEIWFTPNTTAPAEKQKRGNIQKRYNWNCPGGSPRMHNDQQYRGMASFCNSLQNSGGVGWGASASLKRHDFQTASGNWEHFRDTGANQRDVWFQLKAPSGQAWSWNNCYNTMFEVIWRCSLGSGDGTLNGGRVWNFNGGWEGQIWYVGHS